MAKVKELKAVLRTEPGTSLLLPVKTLDFDRDNPRFPQKIARGPLADLLQRFVRDERLLEIVESIGHHGFFPGEPLLVVAEPKGRYRVVEGNRRLAALKLLTKELAAPAGRTSIEDAVQAATYRPEKVPCLVFGDENEILRYLGLERYTEGEVCRADVPKVQVYAGARSA